MKKLVAASVLSFGLRGLSQPAFSAGQVLHRVHIVEDQ